MDERTLIEGSISLVRRCPLSQLGGSVGAWPMRRCIGATDPVDSTK